MPDWRDPSTYNFATKLTTHQWAWEFLRRNPDYREFWIDWESHSRPLALALAAAIQQSEARTLSEIWALPEYIPFGELQERLASWWLREAVDPAVDSRVDAAVDSNLPTFFKSSFLVRMDVPTIRVMGDFSTMEDYTENCWPGYPNFLRLELDLRLPRGPQLEMIKRQFDDYRERAINEGVIKPLQISREASFSYKQFVTYLRLLDGEAAGASMGELGRVLCAEKSEPRTNARRLLETAKSMMETNYRQLLLGLDEILIQS